MPPTSSPPPGRRSAEAHRWPGHPFTDPRQLPGLYADQGRVQRRSTALLSAKVQGLHVGETTATLLGWTVPVPGLGPDGLPAVIADIGCGQGRPTRTLAQRLPLARVLAIDASTTMLDQARTLLNTTFTTTLSPPRNIAGPGGGEPGRPVALLAADFHRLPLHDGSLDAATAVFCLYHSPHPQQVIGEIARTLRPGGTAVLVSKSTNSYRDLDHLMADSGLDPGAARRASLYAAAGGEALADLAATALNVQAVLHDRHVFRFGDAAHLTDYLLTVPKYRLAAELCHDPAAVAARLRRHHGDRPFEASSTITYVLARKAT